MLRLFNAFLVFCLASFTLADQTQTPISFQCTGQLQSYTIPVNVTRISATVCGASGGGTYAGQGQCLTLSQIPVTPGQVLYIAVGCAGGKSGGYNGGGAGSGYGFGGGGGGASDIRTQASILTSRIVVAAGGGGTGYDGTTYSTGGSGNFSSGSGSGYGGLAKLNAGGAGGKYFGYPNGYSGVFGVGGAASSNGGGGGGGWYGGGGATYNGGGGGGSTYYSVGTKSSAYLSYNSNDHGFVMISPIKQYTMTLTNKTSTTTVYFPSDVNSINVVMAGAQGGSTSMGKGGKGAYISATITGPFFSYGVYVTVGGSDGKTGGGMPTASAYCRLGGVGGGYSSLSYYVRNTYDSTVNFDIRLIAGGGGGAGFDPYCGKACSSSSINGGSGGPTGSNGGGSPVMRTSYGGKGGTSFSGSGGGFYNSTYKYGGLGSWKQGGSPASDTCGGGGGGGYEGGGGGSFTGGGGGTSYYGSAVTNVVQTAGANTGGGYVTFTYWSAMNLQPTVSPTLRPTYSLRKHYDDDLLDDDYEEYTKTVIIPTCAVCGWFFILVCLYCYLNRQYNLKLNNRTIRRPDTTTYTREIEIDLPVVTVTAVTQV